MNNTQLIAAANSLVMRDEILAQAEEKMKELRELARVLREETIPNMMLELGVTRFDLTDGHTITVKQEVYGSIPAANKAKAFAWLEEHGFDGLIKTSVITPFVKGDRQAAYKLARDLQDQGFDTAFKEEIHAQTLKAFVREQLSEGNPIDMELFGARTVMKASVK